MITRFKSIFLNKKFLAFITLIFSTMIFPELISGNTPVVYFFQPFVLFLLFLGYGLPVLLIREFVIINNLNYKGVFFLGLVYGILNEGIMAKTLILRTGLPSPVFDGYLYFAGINWSWTVYILLWHSICSVLFPILLVNFLFSEQSKNQWLNRRFYILGVFGVTALGVINFFGGSSIRGNIFQMAILFLLILVCVFISKKIGQRGDFNSDFFTSSKKPILFGVSTFLIWIIPLIFIAYNKLSIIYFVLFHILVYFLYIYILKKNNWLNTRGLLFFSIGFYIQTLLLSVVFRLF